MLCHYSLLNVPMPRCIELCQCQTKQVLMVGHFAVFGLNVPPTDHDHMDSGELRAQATSQFISCWGSCAVGRLCIGERIDSGVLP